MLHFQPAPGEQRVREVGQQQVPDRSQEGSLTQREDREREVEREREQERERERGGVYSLKHKPPTSSDSAQLLASLCFAWGRDK